MKKSILFLVLVVFLSSCTYKNVKLTTSATIIFKTKQMKFYDKGFITKYNNYTNVQIYNSGSLALNLNIYKNSVCKSTFKCMSSKQFNKEFLSSSYSDDFLYDLFNKKNIYFKDKQNNIFIKVKYDKN